ncbi:MAG: DUF5677 domain-containing protein [Clostridiaceae bacterium]
MTDEEFLKHIMPDIEEHFIQNNRPVIIAQGYEWFREIITLYAKQHNLLEAAILLMDNGMNEEAIILARSAMNNYFLIGYLLNDDTDRIHLKEFYVQPLISRRYFLKNINKMINGPFGEMMQQEGDQLSLSVSDIKNERREIENQIKAKGFLINERPLSILKLAQESDKQGFDLYSMYYADASKFEHSDISSLNIYKTPIDEETPINNAFIMDLNRTDENLKEKIYSIFTICYLDSFIKIASVIANKEPQLQVNYNINKLTEMIYKTLAFIKG